MSFLALGNPSAAQLNHIHYRSFSCACPACWTGEFQGCQNAHLVPRWQSAKMSFKIKTLARGQQRNASDIRKLLVSLKDHKEEVPEFYCLARKPTIQCPTVLLMSHLSINDLTVRCHELKPHNFKANDFGHCLSVLPNDRCNKIKDRCQCDLNHSVNFNIADILEVAVYKEHGRFKNHFQRARGQEEGLPFGLVDLAPNPRNDSLFDKYARKRFQYFNDFFTT